MDLQLATFGDIIEELDRRRVQFLLVGVEPSNKKDANIVHISAAAPNQRDLVRLLRMARSAVDGANRHE
jgi:hypothetical protein